jgi:hypothetical protein
MNAALTLEQIIQQELEAIIAEQRGAVIRQAPTAKFNAKRVAKQIYDAKGTFSDDEQSAINAIRQIKNIDQYKQVFSSLKRLTGGRGIAAYLKSFLSAGDIVEVAIHLYDVLPASQYSWTVKKLVTYDMLKTALSTVAGKGSRYNKMQYGDLPGRSINQIRKMFDDPAMYKDIAQRDDFDQQSKKGVTTSDILLKPFVSTEYYLTHNTWTSFVNAPGGLRDMTYSPAGIGITTAASMIPSPWTKVPVKVLFGMLAIDDVTRIVDGNDEAWFDLLFDSIGIAFVAGAGKLLKPIAQRFNSFIKWIKSGGVLVKISQKMFAKLFEIVEAFSKTKLGNYLSGGAKVIDALQSTITRGISKSLSMIKNILTRLKNSTPDPVKSWAANALEALKSTSADYYIQEIKPMFDGLRMIAKVLREFIRAPKTAILDLARRLGIQSEWVIPVSTGVQAAWVAKLFIDGLPIALSWWEKWIESEMNQQQQDKYIQEAESLIKQYKGRIYSFKKKPGQQITLYSYSPSMNEPWDSITNITIKSDSATNGPALFIVNQIQDEYAKITIPSVMIGIDEFDQAWVKLSEIQKI